MKITLNGEVRDIAPEATLGELVSTLNLRGPAAAQINEEIIPHQKFNETVIHDGDVVDIFLMMGGG